MSEKWKLKNPQASTTANGNNEIKSALKKATPGGKVCSTIL